MNTNCWGCFGSKRHQRRLQYKTQSSQGSTSQLSTQNISASQCNKVYEEILLSRVQNGLVCRVVPVKETKHAIQSMVKSRLYTICLFKYNVPRVFLILIYNIL